MKLIFIFAAGLILSGCNPNYAERDTAVDVYKVGGNRYRVYDFNLVDGVRCVAMDQGAIDCKFDDD